MDRNKVTYLYCTSLVVALIASAVIAANAIFNLSLPDIAIRICGVVDLIAIPVMVFAFWRAKRRDRY